MIDIKENGYLNNGVIYYVQNLLGKWYVYLKENREIQVSEEAVERIVTDFQKINDKAYVNLDIVKVCEKLYGKWHVILNNGVTIDIPEEVANEVIKYVPHSGGGASGPSNIILMGEFNKNAIKNDFKHLNVDGIISLLRKYNVPNVDGSQLFPGWDQYNILDVLYPSERYMNAIMALGNCNECSGGYYFYILGEEFYSTSSTLYEALAELKDQIEEIDFTGMFSLNDEGIMIMHINTEFGVTRDQCSGEDHTAPKDFAYITSEDYMSMYKA